MTVCTLESSVPDWVIEHPKTLAVFQRLGIDYSCGGKSLEFACRERGLKAEDVLTTVLQSLKANEDQASPDAKVKSEK